MGKTIAKVMKTGRGRILNFHGTITIGGTGAVVAATTVDDAYATVTRVSAGLYKVEFPEGPYADVFMVKSQLAGTGAGHGPSLPYCQPQTVSKGSATAKASFNIGTYAADTTTATDPASGETIYWEAAVRQ
jgi:hypothetical protein